MFSKDIGIDLGTANVLIYVKGKGIILNEPSVVAMDRKTEEVLAVGTEARKMMGRTPKHIVAVRPLKDGVIHNFDVTEAMLKHFMHILKLKGFMTKPRILICCPTNITSIEQNAIREVAEKAGGKKVYVEVEPKVAAIGAGLDIYQPNASMVIDIGGGTTDVAVLSMGDIVTSETIKTAGDSFDRQIMKYVKDHHKLLIGEKTAEKIKVEIGTALKHTEAKEIEIRGRDILTGFPRTLKINSMEIGEALKESVNSIVEAARMVLEKTPPELASDIIESGAVLTGGGALLDGLDQLLAAQLQIPVSIAENPLECVALGTGLMLEAKENIFRKSKQRQIADAKNRTF
ncbi:rod shape-determining protein [Microbacterium sp. APC 3898]|uniref:Cell shape-determining protein MreB n=2 Tax=Planococcus TaxID=1372 RepID=A0ABT7ZP72_9BACL|nr:MULTISPECIES: rod shape-determining protein [Terrabacteria group]MBF6632989.1 rod shape-determining protein [Planococcus sp. (in: firmicutes)]MBD8013310.1 rod shape-determining protein [Planococcus wigleyi]MDN3428984.1 rod shape-determining protein [Planococcus sp. APC 4016]MDN3437241.1 rod shape-determining protein [Planococcus sp. APC 3900]MDN3501011.1 rod shape-determining protein [Microbacterium sp. APC 3898]